MNSKRIWTKAAKERIELRQIPSFLFFFFYYPSSFEWEQVNNRYEGFLFSGRERFGFSPPPSVSVGILIKRVGGCRARRPLTSPILIPLKDDKRSFFFFLLTLSTSKLISFVPHMLGNRHETSSWEGALDWEQRRHTFALGNVERKKTTKKWWKNTQVERLFNGPAKRVVCLFWCRTEATAQRCQRQHVAFCFLTSGRYVS